MLVTRLPQRTAPFAPRALMAQRAKYGTAHVAERMPAPAKGDMCLHIRGAARGEAVCGSENHKPMPRAVPYRHASMLIFAACRRDMLPPRQCAKRQ